MKDRQKRDRYEGTRTAHKTSCANCGGTIIVVRHPADALKSAKELPLDKIRLRATHLDNAGSDFLEAATSEREFNALVSTMICEKPKVRPWEIAA